MSGFFLWLRLKRLNDVRNLTLNRCMENLVAVIPGSLFQVQWAEPSPCIRVSYSNSSEEDIIEVKTILLRN